MNMFRFLILSVAIAGLVFACKPAGNVNEKSQSPSYGKEKAPSYGEQVSSYGKEKAPSYGGQQAPSYGREQTQSGTSSKGKTLFNDKTLGGSANDKSCNSCHPDGRGLEKSGGKTEFNIMGMKQNSLEEAVNICIKMPLKGKEIDPEGEDMKNIISYIRSLKAN